MIFCAHTQEGEKLFERHALLFEAKTYSPGRIRQVKTSIAGEDTYPEAIIGFYH